MGCVPIPSCGLRSGDVVCVQAAASSFVGARFFKLDGLAALGATAEFFEWVVGYFTFVVVVPG